ncbi:hypothetical protein COOONC_07519 [Cooperia oncophora]
MDTMKCALNLSISSKWSMLSGTQQARSTKIKTVKVWHRREFFESMCHLGYQQSLAELKSMWKALKDTWTRRRALLTGSGVKSKWVFDNSMSFLEDQEYHGGTVSNLTSAGSFCPSVSRSGSPALHDPATPTSDPSAYSGPLAGKISRKRKSDDEFLEMNLIVELAAPRSLFQSL